MGVLGKSYGGTCAHLYEMILTLYTGIYVLYGCYLTAKCPFKAPRLIYST